MGISFLVLVGFSLDCGLIETKNEVVRFNLWISVDKYGFRF
jgi:hypothetical protein